MVKIIARTATVRDNLNRNRLLMKLQPALANDEALTGLAWEWLTQVTRTTSIEGYDLPLPEDKPEDVVTAFEAYLDMPATVQEQWIEVVNAANAPPGKKAMQPELSEGEKKATETPDDDSK